VDLLIFALGDKRLALEFEFFFTEPASSLESHFTPVVGFFDVDDSHCLANVNVRRPNN
jgi:hypothetical protein